MRKQKLIVTIATIERFQQRREDDRHTTKSSDLTITHKITEEFSNRITEYATEVGKLNGRIEHQNEVVQHYIDRVKRLEGDMDHQKKTIRQCDDKVKQLEEEKVRMTNRITEYFTEVGNLNGQMNRKNETIRELNELVNKMYWLIDKLNDTIRQRKELVNKWRSFRVDEHNAEVNNLNEQIVPLKDIIDNLNGQINSLKKRIAIVHGQINGQNVIIYQHVKEVEKLRKDVAEESKKRLEEVTESAESVATTALMIPDAEISPSIWLVEVFLQMIEAHQKATNELNSEIDQTIEAHQTHQKATEELKSEIGCLKNKLEEANSYKNKYEEAKKDRAKVQSQFDNIFEIYIEKEKEMRDMEKQLQTQQQRQTLSTPRADARVKKMKSEVKPASERELRAPTQHLCKFSCIYKGCHWEVSMPRDVMWTGCRGNISFTEYASFKEHIQQHHLIWVICPVMQKPDGGYTVASVVAREFTKLILEDPNSNPKTNGGKTAAVATGKFKYNRNSLMMQENEIHSRTECKVFLDLVDRLENVWCDFMHYEHKNTIGFKDSTKNKRAWTLTQPKAKDERYFAEEVSMFKVHPYIQEYGLRILKCYKMAIQS